LQELSPDLGSAVGQEAADQFEVRGWETQVFHDAKELHVVQAIERLGQIKKDCMQGRLPPKDRVRLQQVQPQRLFMTAPAWHETGLGGTEGETGVRVCYCSPQDTIHQARKHPLEHRQKGDRAVLAWVATRAAPFRQEDSGPFLEARWGVGQGGREERG
jgi:hypothetical protein